MTNILTRAARILVPVRTSDEIEEDLARLQAEALMAEAAAKERQKEVEAAIERLSEEHAITSIEGRRAAEIAERINGILTF